MHEIKLAVENLINGDKSKDANLQDFTLKDL